MLAFADKLWACFLWLKRLLTDNLPMAAPHDTGHASFGMPWLDCNLAQVDEMLQTASTDQDFAVLLTVDPQHFQNLGHVGVQHFIQECWQRLQAVGVFAQDTIRAPHLPACMHYHSVTRQHDIIPVSCLITVLR